jgi:hypothetical protein
MAQSNRLIELYKIAESALTGLIPKLSDEEITQFISSNRWVVIPTIYEKGKKNPSIDLTQTCT